MPGIVGIISHQSAEQCRHLVELMADSMRHEAFYAAGACSAPEMGVHGGWVALEDSPAAGSVFFNEQRDLALMVSGEFFPDARTKDELLRKGHKLGTDCAGWLVHQYEEQGEDFFAGLNGMFSGLLLDQRRNKAFLFNDRYGMGRIYWHENQNGFYFASEAKALLRILPSLREFDPEGLAQYLSIGCTLEERTLFRNVHRLSGGSLWIFEGGKRKQKRYFSRESWESQSPLSPESFEAEFQETFRRVLPRYFETDSKMGISLTAGLDTRMIMACLPKLEEKPVCYTYGAARGNTLDADLAAQVAAACGLEHMVLRLDAKFFSDFSTHADRTVFISDGGFGVTGAHEIYLSKQARCVAPVRMTGIFGGEVFRGVSTFKPIGVSADLFHPELAGRVNASARQLNYDADHPVSFAAFREIPWNIYGSASVCASQVSLRSPYLDNEMVALAYRTPASLRTSPEAAIRFVRNNSPALGDIPTDMALLGKAKGMAATLARLHSKITFKLDYINNEGLPNFLLPLDPFLKRLTAGSKVLGLHKYLHYRSWFREELADYAKAVLTDAQTRRSSMWNPELLDRMAEEHARGRRNHVLEINAVLTLEAVERLLFRELPREISRPSVAVREVQTVAS